MNDNDVADIMAVFKNSKGEAVMVERVHGEQSSVTVWLDGYEMPATMEDLVNAWLSMTYHGYEMPVE